MSAGAKAESSGAIKGKSLFQQNQWFSVVCFRAGACRRGPAEIAVTLVNHKEALMSKL